jgi:hypothetical protein
MYAAGQHALAVAFAGVVVVDKVSLYRVGQAGGAAVRRN